MINLDIRRQIKEWLDENNGKYYCKCGCGQTIELTENHYIYGKKIPDYILGHNLQTKEVKNKKRNTENLWNNLTEKERQRRLSNLKQFEPREKNIQWKGGRVKDASGYIKILYSEHPYSVSGYIYEHRLKIEKWLLKNKPESPHLIEIKGKKYLNPTTVIHHINENKEDNSLENLMIFNNQAEHAFWHRSSLSDAEKLAVIRNWDFFFREERDT